MKTLQVHYQEISLKTVINYYAKGFDIKGATLENFDAFVDVAKGVVVYKLYVEQDKVKEVIEPEKKSDEKEIPMI